MTSRAVCSKCVERLHLQDEWKESESGALEGCCDLCGERRPTRELEIRGARIFLPEASR